EVDGARRPGADHEGVRDDRDVAVLGDEAIGAGRLQVDRVEDGDAVDSVGEGRAGRLAGARGADGDARQGCRIAGGEVAELIEEIDLEGRHGAGGEVREADLEVEAGAAAGDDDQRAGQGWDDRV